MAVISLLSGFVLILVVIVTGPLGATGSIPLKQIVTGSLLCWFSSLVLIPIHLWIATAGNMLLSIGAGFAGSLAGVLTAPTGYWMFCPWSYAIRLMCPVMGVHPNGVILSASDPLLDTSVILPVLITTTLMLFAAIWLSSLWFCRKELS